MRRDGPLLQLYSAYGGTNVCANPKASLRGGDGRKVVVDGQGLICHEAQDIDGSKFPITNDD
jgi:hypothetical protein